MESAIMAQIPLCGCSTVASMQAFQARDASSILATRTIENARLLRAFSIGYFTASLTLPRYNWNLTNIQEETYG